MSERLSITSLGPYIGAQISGADLTRPLSDNQFEQLYHAVLRHQVVFLREQAITPLQQRALAQRFGELHIHPVYPHAEGVDEIIVLDTLYEDQVKMKILLEPADLASFHSEVMDATSGNAIWQEQEEIYFARTGDTILTGEDLL